MSAELAIKSTRVLLPGEKAPVSATVFISGGKFVSESAPQKTIDVGDLVVMPGVVDTHAHINEPGRTEWEGFETATRACAAGGITTVVDMPLNSIPATTTLAALDEKSRHAEGRCRIDYGFWGGVVPGNASELEPMAKRGALGFKAFLIDSGVDEFKYATEKDLRTAMPILARVGVPLLVHAEIDCGGATHGDHRKYSAYVGTRPPRWEVEAIRMMIGLARETRCHVHIVHLSASDAIEDLRAARAQGVPITAETCPHYLTFCEEEIPDGATQFKCAPPIRDRRNREKLWAGLRDGTIDFVVSDHSPCTPRLKKLETGDFESAWGGIAGIQFSLSVVWTGLRERGIELSWLSDWMCARTAKFAGLANRKGSIAPGMDADLVVWDPEASFTLDPSQVLHRHSLTPYSGRKYFGKVAMTLLRGSIVYSSLEKHLEAPQGKWIRN